MRREKYIWLVPATWHVLVVTRGGCGVFGSPLDQRSGGSQAMGTSCISSALLQLLLLLKLLLLSAIASIAVEPLLLPLSDTRVAATLGPGPGNLVQMAMWYIPTNTVEPGNLLQMAVL